jgi:hypothetical protein
MHTCRSPFNLANLAISRFYDANKPSFQPLLSSVHSVSNPFYRPCPSGDQLPAGRPDHGISSAYMHTCSCSTGEDASTIRASNLEGYIVFHALISFDRLIQFYPTTSASDICQWRVLEVSDPDHKVSDAHIYSPAYFLAI